jgi:hypothetical protein
VQGLRVNHHTNKERVRFQHNMPPQGTHNSQHGVSRDAMLNTVSSLPSSVVTSNTPDVMGSRSSDSESDEISIMEDFDCDEVLQNNSRQDLIQWIKALQRWVRAMENSAERKASDMLGSAQMQCERDEQTYRRINALVLDKIFTFKKFIISQKDLDDFTGDSSLGMVVMNMMKIEMPDRLPFWNASKEIVADAIANQRTTITNDLKKFVMSKYR